MNAKQEFQTFLRKHIFLYRTHHSLSQEKMAELLHISARSYHEQEHGRYGFSSTTFVRFLIQRPEEEALKFLRDARQILTEKE